MHNLYSNFCKFLTITKSVLKPHLFADGNIAFYPNPPGMPDVEIIALSVMSEALSISSENLLFSKLRSDYSRQFPHLISRCRFNIRRRRLQGYIHQVCLEIAEKMQTQGEALIIDSIPLPICANPRIMRSTSCKEDGQVQPDRGYHVYKRKRIETLFSQLTDQMNLRTNYAKTLDGLINRVVTKLPWPCCNLSMPRMIDLSTT